MRLHTVEMALRELIVLIDEATTFPRPPSWPADWATRAAHTADEGRRHLLRLHGQRVMEREKAMARSCEREK